MNTVVSPDDEHIVARNVERKEIIIMYLLTAIGL